MRTEYETDVIAWAREQVELLRTGKLSGIDVTNIAGEIEAVIRRETHRLSHRATVLIAHLLKWKFQPDRRSASWRRTIRTQRKAIARELAATPSLKRVLADPDWQEEVWDDGADLASMETGLGDLPDAAIWALHDILDPDFMPD